MEPSATTENPVLHYLAVLRAARDFGLGSDEIDRLAARFSPDRGSVDEFTEAVADAVLASLR